MPPQVASGSRRQPRRSTAHGRGLFGSTTAGCTSGMLVASSAKIILSCSYGTPCQTCSSSPPKLMLVRKLGQRERRGPRAPGCTTSMKTQGSPKSRESCGRDILGAPPSRNASIHSHRPELEHPQASNHSRTLPTMPCASARPAATPSCNPHYGGPAERVRKKRTEDPCARPVSCHLAARREGALARHSLAMDQRAFQPLEITILKSIQALYALTASFPMCLHTRMANFTSQGTGQIIALQDVQAYSHIPRHTARSSSYGPHPAEELKHNTATC